MFQNKIIANLFLVLGFLYGLFLCFSHYHPEMGQTILGVIIRMSQDEAGTPCRLGWPKYQE